MDGSEDRVDKPWGYYTDLFRSDEVVFKRIIISPGEEISYQRHQKRGEFWYVTQGTGLFKWNRVTAWKARPGFLAEIRRNDAHQMTNTGEEDMVIYEMQYGKCLEEDIIRIEDKYGR